MAKKYDGWTIKSFDRCLLEWFFHETRSEVIKAFEISVGESWRKYRRRGTHKLVKVKLVEVE